jgi:alpha-ketoglutarate-dependent 2,4-dichlorophenoxyacetate dioxygenase
MRLISLGPRFAAELRGVDLIDVATNDAAYCAVREAFEEHSVILFRDQEISDDVQIAFSRAFGPLERDYCLPGADRALGITRQR